MHHHMKTYKFWILPTFPSHGISNMQNCLVSLSKTLLCGTFMFTLSVSAFSQTRNKAYEEYIRRYKELAIEQMERYRIPASITMSQGLLESGAGKSELAKKSNNHFGIKCGGNWNGRTVYHDDDARGECFRAYRNVRESYEDHSRFLSTRGRYSFLFKLKPTDYKGWAHGLKKAGYATNPQYGYRLISLIELYNLDELDTRKGRKKYDEPVVFVHQVYKANELLYIKARRGDTFESLSNEFEISARKLRKYNELDKDYVFKDGDIVYLEKKHRRALKPYIIHRVGEGESMYSISQMYGIRLKNLYKLNKKDADYAPSVGDYLRLR